MNILQRGQRAKLAQFGLTERFSLDLHLPGIAADTACFGVGDARKLDDERYMTFFNQPATPCGAVRLEADRFHVDLSRLPASITTLVFTAAAEGGATMRQLGKAKAAFSTDDVPGPVFQFEGAQFADERAVMVLELYRKDGEWRINAVGQGFADGLDALVRHFGASVTERAPEPASPEAPQADTRVMLEKRIESEAPQLVSLVKKAKLSLEKKGLGTHRARVCLCLDISGSMSRLYREGLVQRFAERILALGCRFDDDGEIDVFLFGARVHHPEPMTLSNYQQYIASLSARYPLEGDTRYGMAMAAIREFYFGKAEARAGQVTRAETPVYVMFVTDGGTSDKALTERVLRRTSNEPIFWQYMGIGRGRKSKSKLLAAFADSDFPFLERLDDLDGRRLDNAGFFSVSAPDEHADDALFDLLMDEYPQWTADARRLGMIP